MRIAVASEDFRTVSGHAGHATRFMVYEAATGREPMEVARLELSDAQTLHDFGGGPHPLDGIAVLIAAGAGQCLVERMQARGVTIVIVRGFAADTAVAAYVMGVIGPLTGPLACGCGHDHHH